ncbi:MAG: BMP family ABC transporter substrate-binding protein [Oscillospiraceae bacterium]|nr:BMP family ABC transporter substrate-binding protein [Oscillospiraceae bacterium]
MKKIIALILALAFVLAFAACGPEEPVDVEEEPNIGEIVSNENLFRVGVIYNAEAASMDADVLAHETGIAAMCDSLGLSDDQIVRAEAKVGEVQALQEAVESCVNEGCGLIFGTDRGFAPAMVKAALEYPDVIFASVTDGEEYNGPENFSTYSGKIYQAFYLEGVAAGMKTESGVVGFVAPVEAPLSDINAFAIGLSRVNPEAVLLVKYSGERFEPELERQAAAALLDMGCDVIAQSCTSPVPGQEAEIREVWACGYGAEVVNELPDAYLTAPIWNWGVYYTRVTKAAMEHSYQGGDYYGGMEDGLVALVTPSKNCVKGTSGEINAAKTELLAGTDVFDREIVDNNGDIINPEDGILSRDEILNMDWYYRNIELW